MAIIITDELVEQLLGDVIGLTGETEIEALRRALEERRDRLTRDARPHSVDRMLRVLEAEIWPAIPPALRGTRLSKAEEERLLGFDSSGS